MSAVLGPIHHLMFNRIRINTDRERSIRDFVEEKMSPAQREELRRKHAPMRHELPEGELPELIGDAPIHAWLQEQMERALLSEAAFLAAVCDLPERRLRVYETVRGHGREVCELLLRDHPGAGGDARRLLQLLDQVVLESMPCDHVSQVLAAGEKSFIMRRDLLFHAPLWERAGVAEDLMLEYLEHWMAGLMSAGPRGRFLRAAVEVEGRRMWDDRFMFEPEN